MWGNNAAPSMTGLLIRIRCTSALCRRQKIFIPYLEAQSTGLHLSLHSLIESLTMAEPVISVEYKGRVAIITIDNDKKLNALSQMQYYDLAQKLQEVAKHDEVFVTVLLAKGRYFSAYVLRPASPILILSNLIPGYPDLSANRSQRRRRVYRP